MISLEYYRVFYYVAAYQSISKAAAQLYISQPAVSKTVRKLEEEMNCALFARGPHGTNLTAEGALLYAHVSKGLKEFELGEEKVARLDSGEKQTIRIGATESALYVVLLPVLPVFNEDYPNVSFQIKGCSTVDLVKMLEDGTIDVALGVTPLPTGTGFPVTELQEVQDIVFAHRDFPVDTSIALTPQLLCSLPLVGVGTESSAGRHLADTFKRLGLDYLPTITVETSTNVLPFVENKMAVAIAPSWTLQASSRSAELRELNTAFSIPSRKIFLASSERKLLPPICKRFIDRIKEKSLSH